MGNQKEKFQTKPTLSKVVTKDVDDPDETTCSDVESFLLTYENMMKQQELELFATLDHLQPLLEILTGQNAIEPQAPGRRESSVNMNREFARRDLKRVAEHLKTGGELAQGLDNDQQLAFALELLTSTCTSNHEKISWSEIVLCYRQCILGLQTLEQVSESKELRDRIRRRTMSILASFDKHPPINGKVQRQQSGSKGLLWNRTKLVDFGFLLGALSLLLLVFSMPYLKNRTPLNLSSYMRKGEGRRQAYPLIPGPIISPFHFEGSLDYLGMGRSVFSLPYLKKRFPLNLSSNTRTDGGELQVNPLIPGPIVSPLYVEGDSGFLGIGRAEEATVLASPSPSFSVSPAPSGFRAIPTQMQKREKVARKWFDRVHENLRRAIIPTAMYNKPH